MAGAPDGRRELFKILLATVKQITAISLYSV